MSNTPAWSEIYDGGSVEAEERGFRLLAAGMLSIQEANRQKTHEPSPRRTLHAKIVAGLTNARLAVDVDLPPDFEVGWFRPGTRHRTMVRFSNASAIPQPDGAPDMRGIALKIALADGGSHDLLMTSFPVSHARNAQQFVEFAIIAAGERETMMTRLQEKFGEAEALRMLANLKQGMRPCKSLALERFWSRGAVLWGRQPVRFQLRPLAIDEAPVGDSPQDENALRTELGRRLAHDEVRYRLALQRFVDERVTPIEDGAVEWREDVSPPIDVATLVIPRVEEQGTLESQRAEVDALAFNPWNAPAEFRPLGNLNRARNVVYRMSADRWQAKPA